MESGCQKRPSPICLTSILYLTALSAAIILLYLGYNLNFFINPTYHETIRQEVAKLEALRLQMNHDEAIWEERRAIHEEQERQRHDDEIKKREGISWEGLSAARCLRYATREYTAVLTHVPIGFDAMEECRKKTINIHGRDLLPSHCEDQVGNYIIPGESRNPLIVPCM